LHQSELKIISRDRVAFEKAARETLGYIIRCFTKNGDIFFVKQKVAMLIRSDRGLLFIGEKK
jgi:hypothetical protein